MKLLLPALGTASAIALFAFSSLPISSASASPSTTASSSDTFEQVELFANVMARIRNEYVDDVEDSELISSAINGMLQSLDPHSSYITPENFKDLQINTSGEYGGLGMEVTSESGVVKVITPIDDTPAKLAGVKAGDYITEIDGQSIIGLPLNEAVDRMRGKPGEPITVTIVRGETDPMEITITREVIKNPVVKSEIKDGIGYLRISQFNEKTASSMKTALGSIKKELNGRVPGLVLDLRGNPGGLLGQSIKVSSFFLDSSEVVSTRGRRPEDTQSYDATKGQMLKNVPIIVLIDNASASASEIVAGALQDHDRALLLGMTSFGKGSVQTIIPLRGGRDGALKMTTQLYYTPSGRSIQGSGIDPDIAVSAVQDDGKGSDGFHESDLPNSIQNELDSQDAADEDSEDIVIEYPPEDFETDDDYQLQRAIQILKDGTYSVKMAKAG